MVAPPKHGGQEIRREGSDTVRATARLASALQAARDGSDDLSVAHADAIRNNKLWLAVAEGTPVLEAPNGQVVSLVSTGALAIQAGPPSFDSFGVEWLPIHLEDASVGFTPIVLRKFTSEEELIECWRHASKVAPEQPPPASTPSRRGSARSHAEAPQQGKRPKNPDGKTPVPPALSESTRSSTDLGDRRLSSSRTDSGRLGRTDGSGAGKGEHVDPSGLTELVGTTAAHRVRLLLTSDAYPVALSLGALRSQGFMHGFQLQSSWCREATQDLPKAGDEALPVERRASNPCDSTLSWNEGWQNVLEQRVDYENGAELRQWSQRVVAYRAAFEAAAKSVVEEIVDGSAPVEVQAQGGRRSSRAVRPLGGVAGEDLYIADGIFLERATCDSALKRVYPSTSTARKHINAADRHTRVLLQHRSNVISVPLSCVVTFAGTRFLCTALLPISPSTLAFGSIDGGSSVTQRCRTGPLPSLYNDAVHAGGDGRVYITNVGRLMPSMLPVATQGKAAAKRVKPGTVLTHLVHPEALQSFGRCVSADAFCDTTPVQPSTAGRSLEYDRDLDAACLTQHVRTHAIPSVVYCLSHLEFPSDILPPSSSACCQCQGATEEPGPRFLACLCAKRCSWLCVVCYLNLYQPASEGVPTIRCTDPTSAQHPRSPYGMPMQPDIPTIFHYFGVNLRYLSVVYASLTGYRPAVQQYLKAEMLARAFKQLAWDKMAAQSGVSAAKRVLIPMLKSLANDPGQSAATEEFWNKELGPMVVQKYDLHMPFTTNGIDRVFLLERTAAVTGFALSPSSYTDALQGRRLQIKTVDLVAVSKSLDPRSVLPLPPVAPLETRQGCAREFPFLPDGAAELDAVAAFWDRHLATSSYAHPLPDYLRALLRERLPESKALVSRR
eukprot:gene380-543_t